MHHQLCLSMTHLCGFVYVWLMFDTRSSLRLIVFRLSSSAKLGCAGRCRPRVSVVAPSECGNATLNHPGSRCRHSHGRTPLTPRTRTRGRRDLPRATSVAKTKRHAGRGSRQIRAAAVCSVRCASLTVPATVHCRPWTTQGRVAATLTAAHHSHRAHAAADGWICRGRRAWQRRSGGGARRRVKSMLPRAAASAVQRDRAPPLRLAHPGPSRVAFPPLSPPHTTHPPHTHSRTAEFTAPGVHGSV